MAHISYDESQRKANEHAKGHPGNDDRYDVLKDGVDVIYQDCKAQMEFANNQAKAKFAQLKEVETADNLKLLDEGYEGDVVSLRGHGKARIRTVGAHSKKDRIFIEVEVYL